MPTQTEEQLIMPFAKIILAILITLSTGSMASEQTVQIVGNATDIPLRDAIAKGRFPGPRILTAVEPLIGRGDQSGTPDEIRAFVRKQKEASADLIKIFAAGGPSRPAMTLSQEQLNAACDEAKKQGLRTLVHAYKDAVRAATRLLWKGSREWRS